MNDGQIEKRHAGYPEAFQRTVAFSLGSKGDVARQYGVHPLSVKNWRAKFGVEEAS